MITVSRKAHFNSAHRLHNHAWDDTRNLKVFGSCNNPNFHGHNYELIIHVSGEIDPETGFAVDTKELKELVDRTIIDRFDHKNLNLDVSEFATLNPTTENIAVVAYRLLREGIDKNYKLKITLYETDRNYVEYSEE